MNQFKLLFVLTLTLMFYTSPANAEYSFQLVVPPEAGFTQTFGINEDGIVAGIAEIDGTLFSFTYDMVSGEYTTIGSAFSVLEISNSGVMVGHVDNVCTIRDKKGNFTNLFPPSWDENSECFARGVNSKNKVSGFVVDEFNVWSGFVYNSKKDTYEEFLPSLQTIAHAINGPGQNAGSTFLDENGAYEGSVAGRYGYLRQTDGYFKYFEISQSDPGQTRGRGISENGMIAGFYRDPVTFESKSYVTTLSDGTEFEAITLTEDEMVFQSPCDPNIPPSPGSEYELFTDILASQVRNDGVVVGSCVDTYYNETTGGLINYFYGFIATPIE